MSLEKINKETGKKENRIVTALYCFADALNDFWWLKFFLQALPIIWSTVVLPVFHNIFFDSQTGNLNAEGIIIAIVIFCLSSSLLLLTDLKSSKDKKKKEKTEEDMVSFQAEINLRRALTIAESTLEDRRNRHFRRSVGKVKNTEPVHIFVNKTMYPIERISTALDGLSECFSMLTEIPRTDYTLSGAIAIENINSKSQAINWRWISIPALEGTASISDLLNNNSSFKIVADGKPYYYANDKLEASEKGEYFLDDRDESYGVGSIICTEIAEEIQKWRIRLIISVSTYGKQILSKEEIANGANVTVVYEERIRDIIFKQFEGELKEDLLWYAVENIDFEKGKIRKN